MQVTFRPIDVYPGQRTRWPRASSFSAPWQKTLDLLDRELTLLGAKRVILQLDLTEGDIRLDGVPRANARTSSPAVVIAFESKHGPLKFATDMFNSWQDNVRAIALGLESLRRVDRYGITRNAEQYTGWRQLPSSDKRESPMTYDSAAEFLAWCVGGDVSIDAIKEDFAYAKGVYRNAVKNVHPDVGGDTAEFQRLQEAMRVLGLTP